MATPALVPTEIRPAGLPSLGYTRLVAPWVHRLTVVALALTLSGSPAAVAACMSMCLGAQMGEAEHVLAAHDDHGEPAVALPDAHAHHGASADAVLSHSSHTNGASGSRLMAPCSACCKVAQSARAAGLRAERADTHLVGTAPTAVAVSLHVPPLQPPPLQAILLTPPPVPTRALLVLRI